jgi:hypothetical protein
MPQCGMELMQQSMKSMFGPARLLEPEWSAGVDWHIPRIGAGPRRVAAERDVRPTC